MPFLIKNNMTSEEFVFESVDELERMVKEDKLLTLASLDSSDVLKEDEDISSWIRGQCNELQFVLSEDKLSKEKNISEYIFAIKLIDSEKWNGSCIQFSESIMDNSDFCYKVLQSDKWNGDCRYFNKKYLKDLNFCVKIIKSPRWNGDIRYININIRRRINFCFLVTLCGNWNGSCKYMGKNVLNDLKFSCTMLFNRNWNKNFKDLPREVVKTDLFYQYFTESLNVV